MKNIFSQILVSLLLLATLALQGCGHKGPPIPPEDIPTGKAPGLRGHTPLAFNNYWA